MTLPVKQAVASLQLSASHQPVHVKLELILNLGQGNVINAARQVLWMYSAGELNLYIYN